MTVVRNPKSKFNTVAFQFCRPFHLVICIFMNLFENYFMVFYFLAYADEAHINPVPLGETPWLLQIEWTAKSETPITIFRVQFMVRQGNVEIIIRNWIACYN